jgi:hypothetical protein
MSTAWVQFFLVIKIVYELIIFSINHTCPAHTILNYDVRGRSDVVSNKIKLL